MRSKTSFCNKTLFRKNLTRFAPVWVLYTIFLVVGLFLLYTNGGDTRSFQREYWFALNITEMTIVLGIINLGYALLAAQLLFGDLYNSRMCNMLHAMPVKRETWFGTNVVSGLVFSLVPTAIAAAISLPLLAGSIVENGWQIGLLLFLAANLQYLCFFGIAVFAAMCVGNRFTMTAGYGLLNAGAAIGYWLIDTIYTPMLYGIVTPDRLARNLTPILHMVNYEYLDLQNRSELIDLFGKDLQGAVAHFTVTEQWWRLFVLAAAGIGFLAAALLLYKKRNLECAGDAVAFKVLEPVFLVLCSIFVMSAVQFFLYSFLGVRKQNYVLLALGLIIGWFVGKMLLERSTRVFRLKNWYGLGALAAVLALTLAATYFDVLNIEERMPKADQVEKVTLHCSNSASLEGEEDIQTVLKLHELALVDRAEYSGSYVLGSNGEWVSFVDTFSDVIDEEDQDQLCRYVAGIILSYELKNGNTVERRYNVWVDSPAGEIAEELLNRWEFVEGYKLQVGDESVNRLELVLSEFRGLSHDYMDPEYYEGDDIPEELKSLETAMSFLEAVKADCAAGNMAQNAYFHTGVFRRPNKNAEKGYSESSGFWVYLNGKKYNWDILVFPDSENTVRWLTDHGLMEGIEIIPDRTGFR